MTRVAVVTGVAGGIGRAIAQVFADAGWHVVGVDIKGDTSVPGVARLIAADVSNVEDSGRVFDSVARHEGQLDALVNNAAIQVCKPLVETAPDEWDLVMGVNVRAAYLAVRHSHTLMRGRDAAIVNISSVHALATSRGIGAYAASKGALTALSRALALELAPDRIRVNALLPGAVDTSMLVAGLTRGHLQSGDVDELVMKLGRRHPLGRVGRPREIAEGVLFLADNSRSSFMTGQTLVLDGGALARLSTE